MGPKVTIDSATLMNKGLELLEAHHLFSLSPAKLDVMIHPQSIVHCLVHLSDGSVLAQLSCPDMRTPIAYSLAWPERMHAPTKRLDLTEVPFAIDRRSVFFGHQLDHIFVRGLTLVGATAVDVRSSDHNPVAATLRARK